MNFLLMLQNFRNATDGIFTSFFQKATFFGELNTALVLLAITYWCVDKYLGTYLLMGWNWIRQFNGLFKIMVCEYRPWISNPAIVPDADALKTATGYSFPSGHSMNAAGVFGGISVSKKMDKGIRIACLIVMLLTGFSRMYLGVHYPQDVLVGLISGLLVMYVCSIVMDKFVDRKNADFIIAAISIGTAILIAVYAALKSYPVDYDAEGKVLVEGAKMAKDTFTGVGWNVAFFIGWIIEKRYVNFEVKGTLSERGLRLILGLIGFYLVSLLIVPLITKGMGSWSGCFVKGFLQMIYIVLIYPLIIKMMERKEKE